MPLQLLDLAGGKPCAGQQISQRGLRVILTAGRREREGLRTVAQNLQQAAGAGRPRSGPAGVVTACLISSFRPVIPSACSAVSSWRYQVPIWSAGAVTFRVPSSGVALSLICTRTAIPAS
ncbi:hypothetical protein [Klebsiella sp. X1-16S-Nf21]|uniref:hypothetical protein n=1 Tax=Klebsiella sp. X1-16S-Nf21 TaxID=2057804 RepID=UPI0029DE6133|nr:hypothetical protein [Klebsiella sp. X1-16S-Nf21]